MGTQNERHTVIEYQAVLKEYYSRYLTEVRGLSLSSVKHYLDALNNISRRLKDKELIKHSIYEISSLERLNYIRDVLFADSDFVAMNERGKRMYSAGLNNYCRFASGVDFHESQSKMSALDVPVAAEKAVVTEQTVWKRSEILRMQAIEMAGYACEMNPSHETFIAEGSKKPYMEGHHALPMKRQGEFSVSLDVYANIICLCPICHRRIHYGVEQDRIEMAKKIYADRSLRLMKCGIKLSENEFVEVAAGNLRI